MRKGCSNDNSVTPNNRQAENLIPLSNIHTHNTRSRLNENFYLPHVKTNLGKTSFSFNGPKIWNSLPVEIRASPNFTFPAVLKTYLLEKYASI